MSVATYANLVSAVTEWLARDQDTTLIARIPDFIALCEAKLNRDLYHPSMEKRVYTTFDTTDDEPEFVTLPTDFQSMRRVRLSSITGKPVVEYKSQAQLDEFIATNGDATGIPVFYTIFGSELEFAPVPDSGYTVEIVYRATLAALTASNTTNWLLTLAPDVYLYGTLLETAAYMQQDERVALWSAGYSTALDGLNTSAKTMQFNAQPLVMMPSGATP